MQSHIHQWGNSLGLRIPVNVAKQLKLHAGSPVILEIENGKLVIQTPRYNLEEMLQKVTPENKHHLLLDDTQIGNEEW